MEQFKSSTFFSVMAGSFFSSVFEFRRVDLTRNVADFVCEVTYRTSGPVPEFAVGVLPTQLVADCVAYFRHDFRVLCYRPGQVENDAFQDFKQHIESVQDLTFLAIKADADEESRSKPSTPASNKKKSKPTQGKSEVLHTLSTFGETHKSRNLDFKEIKACTCRRITSFD